MHRPLRLRDRIIIIGVFGSVISYCVWGAIVGDLYVPARRGQGGVHFSGYNAWLLALAPLLMMLGILVRERELGEFSDRMRTVVELGLLITGVGLLFVPHGVHTNCPKQQGPTHSLAAAAVATEKDFRSCTAALHKTSVSG
jgi:hypothetical protein